MSMYQQGGRTLPPEEAARKARVARLLRRLLAVPFWALLALFLVSWPVGEVDAATGWHVARFLAPLLLLPITLLWTMPTTRVVGLSPYRNRRFRPGPGCLVACGFLFGVVALSAAANILAPALVPTIPVNATVTECHADAAREGSECFGSWTVNHTRERGRTLPVTAPPGSTLRIDVSEVDGGIAYAPLSGGRQVLGVAVGAVGVLVTGAGLYELIATRGRIRRGLDDVIAGRATVPARVLVTRPRRR
ncbi:hypothetical protein [Streptomyces kronopolitis]|uniref:hypothetical protein n=1 Tax=Streptomyces kronopolitis TaxID=1612435 RepID=UPI003D999CC0